MLHPGIQKFRLAMCLLESHCKVDAWPLGHRQSHCAQSLQYHVEAAPQRSPVALSPRQVPPEQAGPAEVENALHSMADSRMAGVVWKSNLLLRRTCREQFSF